MKKLILLSLLITGVAVAGPLTYTREIAAGETTATFTNETQSARLFIYNVAVVNGSATNDTFSLRITKGGVDYQVATVSTTTNSVYGSAVVTNEVPIAPLDGVYKVVRGNTNSACNVYVDIRD